jgi:hypothetical protein
MSGRFRITVLTLDNIKLTFHVSKYTISDGDFVEFFDEKTQKIKRFHASRCEIEKLNSIGGEDHGI